jgi:hypothetical protein
MEGQRKPPTGRSFARQPGKSPQERSQEFDEVQRRLREEAAARRKTAQEEPPTEGDGGPAQEAP